MCRVDRQQLDRHTGEDEAPTSTFRGELNSFANTGRVFFLYFGQQVSQRQRGEDGEEGRKNFYKHPSEMEEPKGKKRDAAQ